MKLLICLLIVLQLPASAAAGTTSLDAFNDAIADSDLPYSFVRENETKLRKLQARVEGTKLDTSGAGWRELLQAERRFREERGGDMEYHRILEQLPAWFPQLQEYQLALAAMSNQGGVFAISGLTVTACARFRIGEVCYEKTYGFSGGSSGTFSQVD
jgi:hypothetical protein